MTAIETKHTPGKWVANGSDTSLATWVEDADGKRICTMKQAADDWDLAQLIAQAPDLLAERDRLRQVNAELVAALDRLIFAAECRDNTMGDPSRLIDVKASLVAATVLARSVSFEAKHARAALAKAQAE